MNQLFKEKLNIIAHDKVLIGALSEVFDEEVNKHKPIIKDNESNNLLGEKFRSYFVAKEIVDGVLKYILNSGINSEDKKLFNKER